MTILITGAAGFIGSRLTLELLKSGKNVVGLDNLNDYYDVNLKKYRLKKLCSYKKFSFHKLDLSKTRNLEKILKKYKIKKICHLAAQAGVRYSLKNPKIYLKYNIDGFLNILEVCRQFDKIKLVYASSSSVYGGNKKVPFSVLDDVSKPVSLYAVTKRSNELMAESYSKLFKLNIIGLRFFTVYGPWGRPDMAIWMFTEAMLKKHKINVFNNGNLSRDFTYIDDIIKGIRASLDFNFKNKNSLHHIFNLGNNKPVTVNKMIATLEKILSVKAKKNFLPMQPGDVKRTFADIKSSKKLLGFNPSYPLEEGLIRFTEWYKSYVRN
tara:strand:+ start:614 stop:1582 length:969 start_codon:yes stop_codon:yes gene_type:complete